MNNKVVKNSIRFVALLILQLFVFNYITIDFFEGIVFYPYIIFILMLPISTNRVVMLFASFFFGLIIDVFANTGGAHATACLVLAYVRPVILVSSFGISYENQTLKFNEVDFKELLIYVLVSTLIHHLVLHNLEVFNLNHILFILKQSVLSTLFTSVGVLIYFGLNQTRHI